MRSVGRFKALDPIELDDVVTLGYILNTVNFDTCEQIRENIYIAARTFSLEYILYECLDDLKNADLIANGDYISQKIIFQNVSAEKPGIYVSTTWELDTKATRYYIVVYSIGSTPIIELSFDDGETWKLIPEEGKVYESSNPFQSVKFRFTFPEKATLFGFAFAHDVYYE